MLAALRRQGLNQVEIARALGCHRSAVSHEVRRNSRFTAEDFALVDELLCRQWSHEQVAGYLRRQKNDRRDAGLILDLLLRGEFPQAHRPPLVSREVLLRTRVILPREVHHPFGPVCGRGAGSAS